MSRKSYIEGFSKAAAARGVDPQELARYALLEKAAADSAGSNTSDIWQKVMAYLYAAKEGYDNLPEGVKDLISVGGGAAIGTGLGAAIKGKKGLVPGAIIGGIGAGALRQVEPEQWKSLVDYFAKSKARRDAEKKSKTTGLSKPTT